ncbi:MAG TPA: RHS repeat protein, partial [Pyrinomonadaceae bacterium]|nr:RHS repeat protein [Pyrinomonadaceae bacterium]
MNTNKSQKSRNAVTASLCARLILSVITGLLAFIVVGAQNIRDTSYSPDNALKSNARVNPSTLAMELSIPLGGYRGRAGNGLPIEISYSSKVWEMANIGLWQSFTGDTITGVRPMFAKRSAAGWSSGLGTPRIDYSYSLYQGTTQDVIYEGQTYSPAPWENPTPENPLYYMKRLRVQMPDGSSHEFRASDAAIECGSVITGCSSLDWTGTYLSVDGSKMRLESGSSSSTLYLPDGSYYLFGPPESGNAGTPAHTFRDRNGNKMTFNTSTRTWTDTMGRAVSDPLPFNWNGVQNQTSGTTTMEFPGFDGDTYDIDFTWDSLSNSFDGTSYSTAFSSDIYCNGNQETSATGNHLFTNSDAAVRVCGPGTTSQGPNFDPVVLKQITLPNGQSYQFRYDPYGEIVRVIYPTGAYERFAYAQIAALEVAGPAYDQANRGVTDRWVSPSGAGNDEIHWSYAVTRGTPLEPAPYVVTVTAPDS